MFKYLGQVVACFLGCAQNEFDSALDLAYWEETAPSVCIDCLENRCGALRVFCESPMRIVVVSIFQHVLVHISVTVKPPVTVCTVYIIFFSVVSETIVMRLEIQFG